ncbi:MAG TPA: cytochrome c3 family protein [Kofleriaceae bacterium]|nr:cytochrome c3 family protein [Kofleriaceae bacterium]
MPAVHAAPAAPPGPGAPAPSTRAVGFEHTLHDRDVVVRGSDSLACTRCHAMRGGALVGRPGHAACFGACHGPAPRAGERPGERLAVCTACHPEAAIVAAQGAAPAVHYPPYTLEPNFALTVGHKRHAGVPCATCHAGARPAPHRRCAGCHDGSGAQGRGPAMTACTGCHTPGAGAPLPPAIIDAEINVRAVFGKAGHARHAARGGDGARCLVCHRAIVETDDNRLPAPDAATCAAARCHDGTAAFAITASCTRCHVDPNQPGFKVERPAERYSHRVHAQVTLPCAACHPLTRTGEVSVTGHAPCATCHADDFGLRQPRICGACHNGTEPWRALVADRGPPDRTEFGATLDHERHGGPCTRCHALTTPAVQLRPPRGHRACTGKACHAVAGGPAPRLAECERCHRPGLALDRQVARLGAPWSVRTRFDHASHARAGAASALACAACHVDLHAADVTALPTPPKGTCAPCHDGATAFKLTGTTCTRCHAGAGT